MTDCITIPDNVHGQQLTLAGQLARTLKRLKLSIWANALGSRPLSTSLESTYHWAWNQQAWSILVGAATSTIGQAT